MKVAIIGCGYVADFYMRNSRTHKQISVVGAFDINKRRLSEFCKHYNLKEYESQEDLLLDGEIGMVLNLTNPRSHFPVSLAILTAKKHLYTEKPIAMNIGEAKHLLELANANQLRIGCAPCSVLSPTAQTVKSAIERGDVGTVYLVYANYDDGMIAPNKRPWSWKSESGAPWPAKDEFETGCTYEHAGYFLTWLLNYFGSAESVSAFSACHIQDKGLAVSEMAPDFSSGCITFRGNGVVARVTAGLVAPEDKSLVVVGDRGYIIVKHMRNDVEAVLLHRYDHVQGRWEIGATGHKVLNRFRRLVGLKPSVRFEHLKLLGNTVFSHAARGKPVDFFRGPEELCQAIFENRNTVLNGALGLHILEIIEVLQYPERYGYFKRLQTSIE